jgi:hypothetical protein
MRWRVTLEGEQADLDNLVRWFPTGPVCVVRDDDGTHLMGPDLDAETTAGDAYALAEQWLRQINGTATALRGGDYWPVRLASRISDVDRPQDTYVMAGTAHAVARVHAVVAGETRDANGNLVPPPPEPGPVILGRSITDPALAEALRWMGAPDGPNWAHLWKAFEVLRKAAGGSAADLSTRCGVTVDEIDSLRSSANDPTISGDDARHAVQQGSTATPMTIEQGRDFVDRLIRAW